MTQYAFTFFFEFLYRRCFVTTGYTKFRRGSMNGRLSERRGRRLPGGPQHFRKIDPLHLMDLGSWFRVYR